MSRDLGGFTTVADKKEARRAAIFSGGLVFAVCAAVTLRISRFDLFVAGAMLAAVVFFAHRRLAMSRVRKGVVDVVDDDELGVALVLKRDGPGARIPLAKAKLVGRTRTLATVGAVRFQIEVKWEETSLVCNLAIPFRADKDDVDGILPAQFDLDRIASRALDALSYEVKETAQKPEG